MRGPSVVIHTASGQGGQLACPYCGVIVGQFDPKAKVPEASAIIERHHDAPCGLRCAGSAQEHWHTIANGEMMHSGAATCPVCKPKLCPVCGGSRTMLASLWEAANKYGALEGRKGGPVSLAYDKLTEEQKRKIIIKIPCVRCKSTGTVPGYES